MAVVTITKENFEAEVLHSTKPVLLDFWATSSTMGLSIRQGPHQAAQKSSRTG